MSTITLSALTNNTFRSNILGIQTIAIESEELIVNYTDLTSQNLGRIVVRVNEEDRGLTTGDLTSEDDYGSI